MTTRLSDPVNGLEFCTIPGSVGACEQRSISSDADAIAAMSSHGKRRSSLRGVGTSCTAVRGAEFGHNQCSSTGTQPTGFRVVRNVRPSATRLQRYDALKIVWRERQAQRQREKQAQGEVEGRNIRHIEHEMFFLRGQGLSQVPDMAS